MPVHERIFVYLRNKNRDMTAKWWKQSCENGGINTFMYSSRNYTTVHMFEVNMISFQELILVLSQGCTKWIKSEHIYNVTKGSYFK